MKLAYKNFSTVIETSSKNVATIVVENSEMMYRFLMDLRRAVEKTASEIVISDDNRIIDFNKNVELLINFIQFELNQRTLLSKIMASMEEISESSSYYNDSQQILSQIEKHIMEITIDFPCDIICEKLNMQSIIKAIGIALSDDYSSLEEKLLAYMDLARDFLNKKLFILVNVRGLIPHNRLQMLVDSALSREHEILLIDNMAYPKLKQENRLIIDEDLCEI